MARDGRARPQLKILWAQARPGSIPGLGTIVSMTYRDPEEERIGEKWGLDDRRMTGRLSYGPLLQNLDGLLERFQGWI